MQGNLCDSQKYFVYFKKCKGSFAAKKTDESQKDVSEVPEKTKSHPLTKSGVGYIILVFHGSTLVADESATHWRFNGRTRSAISGRWLRSGMQIAGLQDSSTSLSPSLRNFRSAVVFLVAFISLGLYHKKHRLSTKPPQKHSCLPLVEENCAP